MSMNPALAMISVATVQGPAKGTAGILAGAEGFADVIAGIETPAATLPAEGIATGANLRFNVAMVEPPAEGEALAGVAPTGLADIDAATVTLAAPSAKMPISKKESGVPLLTGLAATINGASPEPGAPADKMPGMDEGKPAVGHERDAKDASPEAIAVLPVVAPVIAHAAAAPEASKVKAEKRASGAIDNIKLARDGQVASAGDQNVQRAETSVPSDSRKGAELAPVSLTAVTEIVQNLPPLVQSQVGAVVQAGPSAAIGAPADVGATLSGQVIDMGVGGQWIDRVAREIAALAEGSGHSRFQLSPPNLGRLQIDVWQGEGGGRVQLLTETDEAATRLRQDQASLQADARLSALSLDRIVIDRAPGSFSSSQDQSSQPGTGRQHQGGEPANQPGGQAGQQAAAQGNGGSAAGQGKAPHRRDVFNDHTQPDAQDGQPSGRADDRHVRYA
jgi:flagellar hook-length control protein FliK